MIISCKIMQNYIKIIYRKLKILTNKNLKKIKNRKTEK